MINEKSLFLSFDIKDKSTVCKIDYTNDNELVEWIDKIVDQGGLKIQNIDEEYYHNICINNINNNIDKAVLWIDSIDLECNIDLYSIMCLSIEEDIVFVEKNK